MLHSDLYGGFDVLLRHADVVTAFRNHKDFASERLRDGDDIEMDGGVGLKSQAKWQDPLEGLLYVKAFPGHDWEIMAGPGVGLIAGYGIPVARVFGGVR